MGACFSRRTRRDPAPSSPSSSSSSAAHQSKPVNKASIAVVVGGGSLVDMHDSDSCAAATHRHIWQLIHDPVSVSAQTATDASSVSVQSATHTSSISVQSTKTEEPRIDTVVCHSYRPSPATNGDSLRAMANPTDDSIDDEKESGIHGHSSWTPASICGDGDPQLAQGDVSKIEEAPSILEKCGAEEEFIRSSAEAGICRKAEEGDEENVLSPWAEEAERHSRFIAESMEDDDHAAEKLERHGEGDETMIEMAGESAAQKTEEGGAAEVEWRTPAAGLKRCRSSCQDGDSSAGNKKRIFCDHEQSSLRLLLPAAQTSTPMEQESARERPSSDPPSPLSLELVSSSEVQEAEGVNSRMLAAKFFELKKQYLRSCARSSGIGLRSQSLDLRMSSAAAAERGGDSRDSAEEMARCRSFGGSLFCRRGQRFGSISSMDDEAEASGSLMTSGTEEESETFEFCVTFRASSRRRRRRSSRSRDSKKQQQQQLWKQQQQKKKTEEWIHEEDESEYVLLEKHEGEDRFAFLRRSAATSAASSAASTTPLPSADSSPPRIKQMCPLALTPQEIAEIWISHHHLRRPMELHLHY